MKGKSSAKADDVGDDEEEQVDGYALDVAKPLHIKKHEAEMRNIINEVMNEFERCTDDYKPFTSLVLLGSNNEDNFDSAMKMNDPRCHLDLNVSLDLFRRLPSVITKIDNRNPDHLALAARSSDIASAYSSYFIVGMRLSDPLTGNYIDVDNRSTEQKVAKNIHRAINIDPKIDSSITDDADQKKPASNKKKKREITTYPYADNNLNAMKRRTAFNGSAAYRKTSKFPATQQDCPSILCCTDGPSRSSDAMNMRKAWVLWTNPMRDSKTGASNNVSLKNTPYPKCSDHPKGCARRLLKVGAIVKVDATECYLIQGLVWLVALRSYDRTTNEFKCTVGWVKCLYNQLHLVGNRIAMIKAVTHDDYKYHTQISNKATWMGKCCMGAAEAWFLDGL